MSNLVRIAIDKKDFDLFKTHARYAFLDDNPEFQNIKLTDRFIFHRMMRLWLKGSRYEIYEEDEE